MMKGERERETPKEILDEVGIKFFCVLCIYTISIVKNRDEKRKKGAKPMVDEKSGREDRCQILTF